MTKSIIIRDKLFTFHQLKVSTNQAQKSCENQGTKLAVIRDFNQLEKFSENIEAFLLGGFYDIWHVGVNDKNGFICKDYSRKMIKFLMKSKKIRLVAKYRDVAFYSDKLNSESKTLGNYICMDKVKIVEMSTTPSYSSYDNTITALPIKNVTATNSNSVSNDILMKSSFQYQNVMQGNRKTESSKSILGILICSVLFVIVLVILTLYFVFWKRNYSRQYN